VNFVVSCGATRNSFVPPRGVYLLHGILTLGPGIGYNRHRRRSVRRRHRRPHADVHLLFVLVIRRPVASAAQR
jgi:hypothetical protein